MDFTSCFLCSSTKNVEKTCFILFSLDGVRAIVYNKNSDNKTPCKRSGCGLIKSLLFLFFHKRLSLVLLSPFFCSIFCFCPFLFGKRVFFTLFEKTQKTKSPVHPVRWRRRFFICLLFGNHFRQRIVRSLSARYSACPESGKTPFLKNERKIIYVRKAMRFAAYLLLIAACAAASLAIGTRNGEQET